MLAKGRGKENEKLLLLTLLKSCFLGFVLQQSVQVSLVCVAQGAEVDFGLIHLESIKQREVYRAARKGRCSCAADGDAEKRTPC